MKTKTIRCSQLENGHFLDFFVPVGEIIKTQWGDRRVAKIVEFRMPTAPDSITAAEIATGVQ